MEANKYIHHDIKLENFLVNQNLQVKLNDFALTSKIRNNDEYFLVEKGTQHYMAPELFSNEPNNKIKPSNAFKIDYYAFGICTYRMICNSYVFPNKFLPSFESNKQKIREKFQDIKSAFGERQKLSPISYELFDLIKGLLNPDIEDRFNLSEIKEHKWITKNQNKLIPSLNYYYEMYSSDNMRYLNELNKIDYSNYLKNNFCEIDFYQEKVNEVEIEDSYFY
jgi:carbon catabolite-derepressing protein kinase